jgi:branched-subunit amino acid aminotransferase/4-amino-4-deoxychorismate lyase
MWVACDFALKDINRRSLEWILGGITRDTIFTFIEDENIETFTGPLARDELYCADEILLTSTAAEVTPVRAQDSSIGDIDHRRK